MVFEKDWTDRAATVTERFSQPKPYRFLTGAALKKASQTRSKRDLVAVRVAHCALVHITRIEPLDGRPRRARRRQK